MGGGVFCFVFSFLRQRDKMVEDAVGEVGRRETKIIL